MTQQELLFVGHFTHTLTGHCYTFSRSMKQTSKAHIILEWFLERDNEFPVVKWPPELSDLNPVEQLGHVVEQETDTVKPLGDAVMSTWAKVSEEFFKHLLE